MEERRAKKQKKRVKKYTENERIKNFPQIQNNLQQSFKKYRSSDFDSSSRAFGQGKGEAS